MRQIRVPGLVQISRRWQLDWTLAWKKVFQRDAETRLTLANADLQETSMDSNYVFLCGVDKEMAMKISAEKLELV
jgi:hypothetical protein